MSVYDASINTLGGESDALAAARGKATLVVNVASKCGFTPQYEGLQRLHDTYSERGFTVVGVPCNQFLEQEPGSPDEIQEFCSVNYGVTFPLTEKIEVNGENRHPLFEQLAQVSDADGKAGDVDWNFEKFLVSSDGEAVARFRTGIEPEDPQVVESIESQLSG